jgi:prepilin-type N-terminal cleavage/methylation domain-containing protein
MAPPIKRYGFTLVELLVVISIITLLLGLLLPAIQKVRAAADKLRCSSNLRQLGIALHHYHFDHDAFPVGGFYPTSTPGWSVQARLLPYIEEDNVHKMIDFALPYSAQPAVTQVRVPILICPSDPNIKPRPDGPITHHPLSYVANLGVWFVFDPISGQSGNGAFPVSRYSAYRGVTFASVTDGTSHTVGFSECKSYTPYLRDSGNPVGQNASPPTTPADVIALGGNFKADSGHTEWVDARVHQTGFTALFPPNTKVPFTSPAGVQYDEVDFNSSREGTSLRPTYAVVTARSWHMNCVNALFLDGSVRSVGSNLPAALWQGLCTRSGGEDATLDE